MSRSVSTLDYQELVDLLSANSKHQVLKDGVKLGKQLMETISEQEAASLGVALPCRDRQQDNQ
jgi:hypothetical protein